jgi:hypothetical protein
LDPINGNRIYLAEIVDELNPNQADMAHVKISTTLHFNVSPKNYKTNPMTSFLGRKHARKRDIDSAG